MLCRRYWPAAALKDCVAWYWTLEWTGTADVPTIYRLIPDGYVDWVFHLNAPWSFTQAANNSKRSYQAHLFGHSTSFLELTLDSSATKVFGIKFQPWAARQIWGTTMHATTNIEIDLADLPLPEIVNLIAQIHGASNTQERISLAEQYLQANIETQNDLKPIVELLQSNNGCSINGLSSRRLQQRFKSEIGISPKVFRRTVRINRVLQHMLQGTAKLTDLAYQNGYYDQSHFIRDFRTFTGLSPSTFLRSIDPSEDFFNLRVG